MRSQTFLLFALVALATLSAPRLAMAQTSTFPRGHSDNPVGPTVSPYLNLLQNSGQFSGVPNYQTLVKPLIEQQNAIQEQGGSLQRLQKQVNAQAITGPGSSRGTGHASYFMNYSHFYSRRR